MCLQPLIILSHFGLWYACFSAYVKEIVIVCSSYVLAVVVVDVLCLQECNIEAHSRFRLRNDVVAVNVIDDIVQHVLVIESLFVSVIVHYSPYDLAVGVAFGVCDQPMIDSIAVKELVDVRSDE
eukprot:SAG31_NODE_433_length_15750_cov_6.132579_8_plen_124_part_00